MDYSSPFHFQSFRARPLFRLGSFPVYLSTALAGLQIVCLLASIITNSIVGNRSFLPVDHWAGWFAFAAPDSFLSGELWRYITYPLVPNKHLFWFVLDLILLFQCGRLLEELYGRGGFGWLYVLLLAIPPVLFSLWSLVPPGYQFVLAGTQFAHFFLLLALAFVHPNIGFLFHWLKLKYIVGVLFALHVIGFLSDKQQLRGLEMLSVFMVNAGVTYFWLRRCGLSPRFGEGEFSSPRPRRSRKLAPARARAEKSEKPKYEPKIRPRPQIGDEHPVVSEIDTLLEKISVSGMSSLTPEEREALEKASAALKNKDRRR